MSNFVHVIVTKILDFKKSFASSSYLKNSIWVIFGALISKGLNFIAITIIAKLLGPEKFGEYNVVQTTVGLFGTISGVGFGLAATKLIAEWRSKDMDKVGQMIGTLYVLSMIISVVVAIFFYLSAEWISYNLLGNGSLEILLKITALVVVFNSINGVQNGVLSGFEAFRDITRINFVAGIISAPLLALGTYLYGLTGLSAMLLLTQASTVLITRMYIKEVFRRYNVKISTSINRGRIAPIFSVSAPSFLSSLLTTSVNWASNTVFVNQPGGFANLGTYNAASQLRQLALFLPDSAGKVSIPKLANSFGMDDKINFRKTVFFTFLVNLALSVGTAIFIFLFNNLFKELVGSKYQFDDLLIIIILLISVFIAISNALGYIFICSNLIWYDFFLRVFWGGCLVTILVLYGKFHGAIGFGLATLGAYVAMFLMQCIIIAVKLRHWMFPQRRSADGS